MGAEVPDLEARLDALADRARSAAPKLEAAGADARTAAIRALAGETRRRAAEILAANARDLGRAREAGLAGPLLDRLRLDPARLEALAAGVEAVAAQPDPVGAELARWTRPNGLEIRRVSTPIGVIAMIYEARPGVTLDAAALALRSANPILLKPGRESLETACALGAALEAGLAAAGLPPGAAQVIPHAGRAVSERLITGLDGRLDLLIPRGGRALVSRVEREGRVPVLGHREGLNHTYVHRSADPDLARRVALNAKMRRTSVCGATETLLVDADAAVLLRDLLGDLRAAGCEVRADARARALAPNLDLRAAAPEDFDTEHLGPVLSAAVVDDLDGALAHIARHGSGHTEAILAEDETAAARFAREVDAAIVMINASTQFADGGEFGFGAEIGIATGRLHARGPIGAAQLQTFKYVVRGAGQTRP